MDAFVRARLAHIEQQYAPECSETRQTWLATKEQVSEAEIELERAEDEDRPFRRPDRAEDLSWHFPSPAWRRPDLEAAQKRFQRIQEATSLYYDRRRREVDAQETYVYNFALLAVSNILWTLVEDHLERLTSSWRKLVRPRTFEGIDASRFDQVWVEFEDQVIRPAVQQVCVEHGEPARRAVEAAVATERPVVYQFIGLAAAEQNALSLDEGALTPWQYERLCSGILAERGWKANTTAGSGDQGVDVIAEREGIRVILQCKLYGRPVGNKAVQEAVAARGHERAHAAAVVSNAGFTRAAEDLALTNAVALLHHSELADWGDQVVGRLTRQQLEGR